MRHFLRTAVQVVSSALIPNALSADGAFLCADSLQGLCPIRLHLIIIIYNILQPFFVFVNTFFHIRIDKFQEMRYSIYIFLFERATPVGLLLCKSVTFVYRVFSYHNKEGSVLSKFHVINKKD